MVRVVTCLATAAPTPVPTVEPCPLTEADVRDTCADEFAACEADNACGQCVFFVFGVPFLCCVCEDCDEQIPPATFPTSARFALCVLSVPFLYFVCEDCDEQMRPLLSPSALGLRFVCLVCHFCCEDCPVTEEHVRPLLSPLVFGGVEL